MAEISWELFYQQVEACTMCPLHATVTHKVPGQGDIHAPLMFIGEGPGQREDEEGIAFVGAAGQLLTKMLSSIYLPRDRVYICNVVKCRPPNNRTPNPQEMEACLPYLRRQIAAIREQILNAGSGPALPAELEKEKALIDEACRILSGNG